MPLEEKHLPYSDSMPHDERAEAHLMARGLWRAARSLDPTGRLEWTFPSFLYRALALQPDAGPEQIRGLDLVYEQLETWDDIATVLLIRDALLDVGERENWVPHVSLGVQLFDGAYRAAAGRLPLPEDDEPFRGRHFVGYLDLDGPEQLRFLNSWGDWGDDGAGYISRAYFERYVDAVWLTRPSFLGPSPAMETQLREQSWRAGRPGLPTVNEIVSTWSASPNRIFAKEVDIGGTTYDVRGRSTYALRSAGQPLQIIDLRLGDDVLGRLHVHHDGASGVTTIEELFVRPDHRRRGLGSFLDEVARDLALRRNARILEIWLHEADAEGESTSRAEEFASRNGYAWDAMFRRTRPNIHGIGRKAIA